MPIILSRNNIFWDSNNKHSTFRAFKEEHDRTNTGVNLFQLVVDVDSIGLLSSSLSLLLASTSNLSSLLSCTFLSLLRDFGRLFAILGRCWWYVYVVSTYMLFNSITSDPECKHVTLDMSSFLNLKSPVKRGGDALTPNVNFFSWRICLQCFCPVWEWQCFSC